MKRPGEQIAALPIRWDEAGKLRVLMITSRDTGRWVIPKGWIIAGLEPWDAAAVEALDEAGAEGRVSSSQLGAYIYDKVLDDGASMKCEVRVFPMLVGKLNREWKERNERTRRWFSLKAAAKRVAEPDLAELLKALAENPEKLVATFDLKKAS